MIVMERERQKVTAETLSEIFSKRGGIRCAQCWCCDTRVYKTDSMLNNQIKRYRQCRACGYRFVTIEAGIPRK